MYLRSSMDAFALLSSFRSKRALFGFLGLMLISIAATLRAAYASWGFANDGEGQKPQLKYDFVTCGSLVKLANTYHGKRLHSHDVKYGTGSGQQSVTGLESTSDAQSYWRVKGPHTQRCKRGQPVRCGDTIRLEHSGTKTNLHSHHFPSPMTRQQEVSCFGEPRTGDGDTGDNWIVECASGSKDDKWRRDIQVAMQHVDTRYYLSMTGNVFGRPISGHHEVVAVSRTNGGEAHWRVEEGLFIMPTTKSETASAAAPKSDHAEL